MNNSIEISDHVQNVVLDKVARHAWETELVNKFEGSYIRNKVLLEGRSLAINSNFDRKIDDDLVRKPVE